MVTRVFPAGDGNERTVLTGFLDWQRATVRRKAEGLSDTAAHKPLMVTSPQMTVAGVVSHLRVTEHGLFARSFPTLSGDDTRSRVDAGWTTGDRTIEELLRDYDVECEQSRSLVRHLDLDAVQEYTPPQFSPVTVRWMLTHMIEETARHLGHLDVLREQLDGSRGY